MECLSLRISGKKKQSSRKCNDSWSLEFISVVRSLEESCTSQWHWLSCLEKDSSHKDGVSTIKDHFERALKETESADIITVINLILKIYIKLKPSNPLKQTLLGLLPRKLKDETDDTLSLIVLEMKNKLIAYRIQEKDFKISDKNCVREFADLLHCFVELFSCIPAVTDYLDVCLPIIFNIVDVMFSQCLHFQSDEEASLVAKEEVLDDLHFLTQQVIILFQKIPVNQAPELFLESCLKAVRNECLPMNTKFNFAIILSLANKVSASYDIVEMANSELKTSPMTAISLCSGILSSKMSTNSHIDNDTLKKILSILLKVDTLYSSDCKLTLAVSRGISVMTKHLLLRENISAMRELLHSFVNYLIPHIDDSVDAVRHQSTDSLSNAIGLLSKNKDEKSLDEIIFILSEIPVYKRAKYTLLSYVVSHVTVKKLLQKMPDMPEFLLKAADKSSGAKHVLFSLESVIRQHYYESNCKDEWMKVWVTPLIKAIHDDSKSVLLSVLGTVIKLNPDVLNQIFSLSQELYPNKTKLVLASLNLSQKLGLLQGNNCEKWKGMVPYEVLLDSLHHRDDEVRLTWLGLLIENPKSTCEFTSKELSLLQTFFEHNIHNQWPSFRQSFISYFKKFLIRLSNSEANCKKIIEKYVNRPPEAGEKDLNAQYRTIYIYGEFKGWIIEFCYINLFEGASFSRRNTILQMLTLLKEYNLPTHSSITILKATYQLIRILSMDTYEENKHMAKNLLTGFSLKDLYLETQSPLSENKLVRAVGDCFKLVSSIRPPDCVSAAYCLSALLRIPDSDEHFILLSEREDCTPETSFQIKYFVILSMVAKQLMSELLIAKLDLAEAAKSGPLYGLLFMARHILQDIDLRLIGQDDEWLGLMKKLMNLAIDCCKAVACVVNNSSPEGHLPMDLTGYGSCLSLSGNNQQVTSQLLLLCSWRTVKESCLLLGEIVDGTPIVPGDDYLHFCTKDVIVIGEHFTSLLAEIKHRGAFEQAYVGFCKLASVLWKYPEGELHNLPTKWLQETLVEIASNNSLCATRRSAGIPYIIQALVCTEREMLGGKHFQSTINQLIEFGMNKDLNCETRIHSMNILRSLFRNSQLGELVSPYIARGFIIAFNLFPSDNWSERNSATLLFSALMTRVFGVIRSKSLTLNWKNKMTSRIFFQKYPSLYNVILEKLSEPHESNLHTVFPVLLLLGRLYPSSLEGTDSILELDKFIPFVNKCSESKIMIVRNLAASALVGLLTPNDMPPQISLVLDLSKSITSENHLHGLLLQVLQLVKFRCNMSDDGCEVFESSAEEWFKTISNHFTSDHSLVVKSICLNILNFLLVKFPNLEPTSLNSHIFKMLRTLGTHEDLSSNIGSADFISSAVATVLVSGYRLPLQKLEGSICSLLSFKSYEIFQVVTDFLLYIFDKEYESSVQDVLFAIECYHEDPKQVTQNFLRNSSSISGMFLEKLGDELHHEDLNKILLCAKEMHGLLTDLFESVGGVTVFLQKYFINATEKLKSSSLQCLLPYLHSGGTCTQEDIKVLGKVLLDSVNLDYDCRIAAASLLNCVYYQIVPSDSVITTIEIWTSILHFLCDDSQDVRDIMSLLVSVERVDSYLSLKRAFKLFEETSPSIFVYGAALAFWSVAPFVEQHNPISSQVEEKAFDKGDTNSYKEDLLIAKLSCNNLEYMAEKHPTMLKTDVPVEILDWFQDFQPYDPDNFNKNLNNIYGFLMEVTNAISDEFNELSVGYRYFSYFHPKFCDVSLRSCKSKFLYDTLRPYFEK